MSENIQKNPLPCGGGLGMGETQSIKQGYKQTSLGILPQEWEVVRLGDICEFLKGKGISKDDLADNGIPCIRYGELYTIYDEIIQKVVSRTNLDSGELIFSKANDIVLPTSGETAIDICKASCVMIDNVALGGDLNVLRSKQNGAFLSYYINHMAKYDIAKLAQGVSIVHLYASELKSLQIPLPPLAEQEKIAQILGVWDKDISVLKSLIEAKTKRKKALMQRLLTPPKTSHTDFSSCHSDKVCHTEPFSCHTERSEVSKNKGVDFVDTLAFSKHQYDEVLDSCNSATLCHTEGVARSIQKDDLQATLFCLDSSVASLPQNDRGKLHNVKNKPNESSLRFAEFTDKWQEMRLGDICEIYQPQTIPQSDFTKEGYNVYGANGIIGKYHSYNHEKEQIAIACRGNSCGAVNFTNPKSWITGNAMVINLDNSKNADKIFVYYVLLNSNLNYLVTGSGQPQITSNIKNHSIKLPTLAEQKKIAQVLSACDKEIELLKSKFQCLKTQKKGLMQRLLNGEVRVKC